MNTTSYLFLTIILAFLTIDFLLERLLSWLNSTRWSEVVPPEVADLYDREKYRKAQQYDRHKRNYSTVVDTLTFLAMAAMLLAGGFAWLDHWIRGLTQQPIPMALLFFGILALVSNILTLPFDAYLTFVIEEKFGFNRTTVKTFVLDRLKGILLSVIIGGGLLSLVVYIYTATGNYFWLIVWGVVALFMVFMTMFYSNLIVPLFNKQKPLDAGPLREAIEAFASRVGFRLNNIYVIDGSKRSSKANAYFTGLGAKKRIVLYDTLIKDHTTEELVAVLAHEVGHYKKRHTTTGMILGLAQTGLMLFILSLFIQKESAVAAALCQSLSGFSGIPVLPGFHLGIMAFGLLYSPLSTLTGIVMNIISRRHEYAADRFAGQNYSPSALAEALKKLSVNNLSNLTPHPAYVFFYYSHPTLLQRLTALNQITIDRNAE